MTRAVFMSLVGLSLLSAVFASSVTDGSPPALVDEAGVANHDVAEEVAEGAAAENVLKELPARPLSPLRSSRAFIKVSVLTVVALTAVFLLWGCYGKMSRGSQVKGEDMPLGRRLSDEDNTCTPVSEGEGEDGDGDQDGASGGFGSASTRSARGDPLRTSSRSIGRRSKGFGSASVPANMGTRTLGGQGGGARGHGIGRSPLGSTVSISGDDDPLASGFGGLRRGGTGSSTSISSLGSTSTLVMARKSGPPTVDDDDYDSGSEGSGGVSPMGPSRIFLTQKPGNGGQDTTTGDGGDDGKK